MLVSNNISFFSKYKFSNLIILVKSCAIIIDTCYFRRYIYIILVYIFEYGFDINFCNPLLEPKLIMINFIS
jgi:hypothetical protein